MNIDTIKTKFTSLSAREKIIIVGSLFLAVLLLPHMFLYAPSKKTLKLREASLRNLKNEISSINEILNTQTLPQQKPVTEEKPALPDTENLGGMLSSISRVATSTGVDFISMSPENISYKGQFVEMTVKMELKVKYKELYNFLDKLEAGHKAFIIKELKYETNDSLYPSGVALIKALAYLSKK